MSRTHDRDQLVAALAREMPSHSLYVVTTLARVLMRYGTTLQRLAEAQCNGDWPYDNGERVVVPCSRCGSGCVPSKLIQTLCPDCRTQDRVTALLAQYAMVPIFQGDPRGCVFKVVTPSYMERNKGKEQWNWEGICVS